MSSIPAGLPAWAQQMRDLYVSGSISQYLLHGNLFDVVPGVVGSSSPSTGKEMAGEEKAAKETGKLSMLPLKVFLDSVMFSNYDVILHYDRGRGIRATRGAKEFGTWLEEVYGTEAMKFAMMRETGPALELMDRFLLRTLHLQSLNDGKTNAPRKVAVIIDFAEFVVPRGNPLHLGGEFSANIVKILGWANDPAILSSNIVTVLLTEGLGDINPLVVDNPHAAKLKIPLPDEEQMRQYTRWLIDNEAPDLPQRCEVTPEVLGGRLTGLSRIGARTAISLALRTQGKITSKWLSGMKKQMIERECADLLEFMESPFTLDHVAGHDAVKAWLREDAKLLRDNVLAALPMGYLITGRIGTGKTFLVRCWAGELGIPCVVFKNFRDKWVGATESNLEKIFNILRAIGQVVVFIDEADQMTGKREGGSNDSGLSGRVYAMLAAEMSDTRNRGKIIWVFATSRPDLLEVDLKRQGRLDVHVPLFPPQTPDDNKALFLAIAKKLGFQLTPEQLPDMPIGLVLGGNEIEGVLVRALRVQALSPEPKPEIAKIIVDVLKEVRPSPHTRKLEYMDLIAVKECTDERFLPAHYKNLSPEAVETRLQELRGFV